MTRNATIDIARGLGILAVVLGHNWLVLNDRGELFRIIYSFHVPLFFFLSGVLLRESRDIRPFLRARIHGLLKPYGVVLAAALVGDAVRHAVGNGGSALTWGAVAGIVYGTGQTIPWMPLWFLPHLFLASVFVVLFVDRLSGRPKFVLWGLAAGLLAIGVASIGLFWEPRPWLGGVLGEIATGLPWSLDLLPISSAYLLAGYLLQAPVKDFRFRPSMFLAAAALFGGLHLGFDQTMDLNRRLYGNGVISTLQAACGIYLLLGLADALAGQRRVAPEIARFGRASLFVLIFHGIIQGRVFGLLSRYPLDPRLAALLSFLAASLLPLAAYELAKRSTVLAALLLPYREAPAERLPPDPEPIGSTR